MARIGHINVPSLDGLMIIFVKEFFKIEHNGIMGLFANNGNSVSESVRAKKKTE